MEEVPENDGFVEDEEETEIIMYLRIEDPSKK